MLGCICNTTVGVMQKTTHRGWFVIYGAVLFQLADVGPEDFLCVWLAVNSDALKNAACRRGSVRTLRRVRTRLVRR